VPHLQAADPHEDDATQPHVLLAGLGSRPAKPAHAVAPPAPAQVEPPAAVGPPAGADACPPAARPQELAAADRRRPRPQSAQLTGV
jgi:hypothetical protein